MRELSRDVAQIYDAVSSTDTHVQRHIPRAGDAATGSARTDVDREAPRFLSIADGIVVHNMCKMNTRVPGLSVGGSTANELMAP